MVLKRKRSDSEISSASSLVSSPLSGNVNFMHVKSVSNQPIQSPTFFSSRTRKRHRDNRPSESAVHQHTLSLLYTGAQCNALPPQVEHQQLVLYRPNHNDDFHALSTHQPSLHSFWTLPASRSSSSSSSPSSINMPTHLASANMIIDSALYLSSNCYSCDAPLAPSSDSDADAMDVDMDMMMDVHMYGAKEASHACTECGKNVCQSCAVTSVGVVGRRCLSCAGRGEAGKVKRWVGGLGWMD